MNKGIQLCLVMTTMLLAENTNAQWSTNMAVNNAVSVATQNQEFPSIVSDGSGGAIITWTDSVGGVDADLYAQRINSLGVVQWTTNGVAICTATGNQLEPTIVTDGSGGAIITWADYRSGTSGDIYSQHVNASGVVQWTANGVVISNAAGDQMRPFIISDGSSGAIIAWSHYVNSGDADVYAQRINSSGLVQWTANGVAICVAPDYQFKSSIITDGSGGAMIAWQDGRNGTDDDIYIQKVNSSGVAQWTANGLAICTATGSQWYAEIVSDGSGGAIIAWPDFRNGIDDNIYAQRVNSSGVAQWTANGLAVCTNVDDQNGLNVIADGAGGAILTWEDYDVIQSDIYAQRINSSGAVQWASGGVMISNALNYQTYSSTISDGSGGAIITWEDYRNGDDNADIYAQRINSAGIVQGAANGVVVCSASDAQFYPGMVSNGSGGAIITWEDHRTGTNSDIYAQGISSSAFTFISAITGSASVCSTTSHTYSVSPVSGATSYSWTLPSGWSGASSTNVIVATCATTGGTISVIAANTSGLSVSSSLAVTVTIPPTITIAASATSVTKGTNVTLTASGATTYAWSGGITNAVAFTPQTTATYSVTGSTNGCTNSKNISIDVLPAPVIVTPTGIEGISLTNNLTIYPNPTAGLLNIVLAKELINGSIKLTDVLGTTMDTRNNVSGKQFTFDLSNLKAGVYFIEINQNGIITATKVLKQ